MWKTEWTQALHEVSNHLPCAPTLLDDLYFPGFFEAFDESAVGRARRQAELSIRSVQ